MEKYFKICGLYLERSPGNNVHVISCQTVKGDPESHAEVCSLFWISKMYSEIRFEGHFCYCKAAKHRGANPAF